MAEKTTNTDTDKIDLLISHATILTLNQSSDILEDGWIAIDNGNIIGIGQGEPKAHGRTEINAQGKLAMPGLVNTHTHLGLSVLRGREDFKPFLSWLDTINPLEKQLNKEDVYTSSLLGGLELIKSGTTTFNDMYFYPESTVRAANTLGLRGVVRIPLVQEQGIVGIEPSFSLNQTGGGLITYSLAPNPLTDFSPNSLQQIAKLAEKLQIPVHLHFESDASEKNTFQKQFKTTPFKLLEKTGIIKQRTILAHGVYLTDSEIKKLSTYPLASVSFNPRSEYKLTTRVSPIVKLLQNNINVGLGTDGTASTNTLDLFEDMRFTAIAAGKCTTQAWFCSNGYSLNPEKIVRMATIDGAKTLGKDGDIGTIEVNKRADIILLDLNQPHFTPHPNLYSAIVFSAHGSDVADSIIDGRVVMRNRVVQAVKEDEVLRTAEGISERIK